MQCTFSPPDSVYLLLDLCRVTDEAAAFASSRLQHNTLRGDRTLYSRVIAALVVVCFVSCNNSRDFCTIK